jgi:hypothetical protein
MSEPIKVGDLVMIVKPAPCSCSNSLGTIFRVVRLVSRGGHCVGCGRARPHHERAIDPAGLGTETWRLKRIDPLTEPESVEKREEVPA